MRVIIVLLILVLTNLSSIWGQSSSAALQADSASEARKVNYDSVGIQLRFIGDEDQKYRGQLDETVAKYGGGTPEVKQLFQAMKYGDSLNLIGVSAILRQYGWLGSDQVGEEANKALFMVIQHADQTVQEHYLPLMQEAVKAKKLKPSSFALLQDRLAQRQGRKQIYGSQIYWNTKTDQYYVYAIDDPDHVDQLRKSVGLAPIAVYIKDCCQLIWDLAAYKNDIQSLKRSTE